MTLKEFNNKYQYKTDKDKFGFFEVWDIPKLKDDGFYYGDCEDYAIFLKHNIPQFENWDLYYCKLNGIGHCVLYKDGHVIDCNIRQIVTYEKYCSLFNITKFKKYNWFVVGSKIMFAKVYTWIF